MKKLIILLLPLVFIACGKDGDPGKTYLKFTWTGNQPHTFSTNNPAIPVGLFYYNTDYLTSAGTYSLYYETFYGVNYWWSVNYTLTFRPGEEGRFFKDGDDGDDSYFAINCDPGGPFIQQTKDQQITDDGYQILESSEEKAILQKEIGNQTLLLEYTRLTEEEFIEKTKGL